MEDLIDIAEGMISELSDAINKNMIDCKDAYKNDEVPFNVILDNALEDTLVFEAIDDPEKMYEALMTADPEGIQSAKIELAEKGSESENQSIVIEQYIESSAIDRYFEKYD